MRIAVIGAGAAGLAALRHCTSGAYDDQAVCYEKTDQIGGTWVYREETGSDSYGLPIHTSMYKSLRYDAISCRQAAFVFSIIYGERKPSSERESIYATNVGRSVYISISATE